MNEQTKKEWYLGLDIGTNSVGFSATDNEYNILTKGKKLQCGARLFEDAKDASERRLFRSSRRRFTRRKVRISRLQQLFDSVISSVDPSFFIRMNKSGIYELDEENKIAETYPLFIDTNYTDKDFYDEFPTIYHLRKHLSQNKTEDARLLYLACHHIIKYRGHFLFEHFNTENVKENKNDIYESLGVSDINEFHNDKAVQNALKGNKVDLSKLFPDDIEIKERIEPFKEDYKNYKFSTEEFDVLHAEISDILSEEENEYVLNLKKLYDCLRLEELLQGELTFSNAMVKRYDEHQSQLRSLKEFIRNYIPEKYDEMFRENGIYSNYIRSNITHGKKSFSYDDKCNTGVTTISHEIFLKKTDEILTKAKDKPGYEELKSLIDNKTLCLKLHTKENAHIPYQLHKAELKMILEKQRDNFPFLGQTDKYGTVEDKIISLLTFRIPYYVGPLKDDFNGEKFAWIAKMSGEENTAVTPWNFKQVVDTALCGERFINRMTSKCTYLTCEDVVPKQSVLYQKYLLLQDLNNLKINGDRIDNKTKLFLFNGICQTEASLTKAKIKKYLVDNGKIKPSDQVGKENDNDTGFHSSLSSLIKFKQILGDIKDEQMCENIIKWHTVFGDEKEPVKQKIKSAYGDVLTQVQAEKLSKMSFSGWGRLSKRFLTEITATDKTTGEAELTIMQVLETTTMNLQEILNSEGFEPKFTDLINDINGNSEKKEVSYETVKDMYCSPTVKCSIWQAILISKELAKINGCAPKKVFIEVTRGPNKAQKGKTTSSRKQQLEALLQKCLKDGQDVEKLLSELNQQEEKNLRSDRIYLYFTQLGRCMYTDKKIELSKLSDENLYDIDHIYPQSKIKDDSLSNRVLVCRLENSKKGNEYPIKQEIQTKMKSYWQMLEKRGLLTKEKYNRLVATRPLTQEQIGGFINRQLVSTNQAVKETAHTLKEMFGAETEIVYSKASNVSEFRHMFELVKCREVNNLHHAHDAYLNIVVGNEWHRKYTQRWFSSQNNSDESLLNRLFNKEWKRQYLEKIEGYLFDNKKYLGKYPVTVRTYEKKGAFYNQTVHPKTMSVKNSKAKFPTDESFGKKDVSKYGGYDYGFNAYNCLIEYDEKKGKTTKRVRGIFSVPVRFIGRYKSERLEKELQKHHGLTNAKILTEKIPMESVLEVDGIRYYMKTGDLQCPAAVEWYPDKNIIQIVHDIFKYRKLIADKKTEEPDKMSKEDIKYASREKSPKYGEGKSIRRDDNLAVFDAVLKQLKKPFYKEYAFTKKVTEGKISREKFMELSTYEQVEQLAGLLNSITMNGKNFNAKMIGGVANETPIYKITDIPSKNIYLITQSVTGLFENRIALNVYED